MEQKRLFHYAIYGLCIASEFPLGRLPKSRKKSHDLLIRLTSRNTRPRVSCWYHQINDSSQRPVTQFGKVEQGYFVRFRRKYDFLLNDQGDEIICFHHQSMPLQDLQGFLLTQILPLALKQRGLEVLHASAVEIDKGAVLFLGNQGFGKSTLAAAFAAQGFRILSDDIVVVEQKRGCIRGVPSFPEIRLTKTGIQNLWGKEVLKTAIKTFHKYRAPAKIFCSRPLPISKIFVLSQKSTPRILTRKLSVASSWQALLHNSFRLDLLDKSQLTQEISNFNQLLKQVKIQSLSYPRKYSTLKRVVRTVSHKIRKKERSDT